MSRKLGCGQLPWEEILAAERRPGPSHCRHSDGARHLCELWSSVQGGGEGDLGII